MGTVQLEFEPTQVHTNQDITLSTFFYKPPDSKVEIQ